MPYVRAASLFVRVGNVGGPLERLADAIARDVTVLPRQRVPVRHGDVETQLYRPEGAVRRSVLLVPGVHSMGIAEPRLTALAHDLAGSGVTVMTMALPDLMAYQITARSADVIEDAVAWMAAQPELGLCSERRARPDSAHSDNSGFAWQALNGITNVRRPRPLRIRRAIFPPPSRST